MLVQRAFLIVALVVVLLTLAALYGGPRSPSDGNAYFWGAASSRPRTQGIPPTLLQLARAPASDVVPNAVPGIMFVPTGATEGRCECPAGLDVMKRVEGCFCHAARRACLPHQDFDAGLAAAARVTGRRPHVTSTHTSCFHGFQRWTSTSRDVPAYALPACLASPERVVRPECYPDHTGKLAKRRATADGSDDFNILLISIDTLRADIQPYMNRQDPASLRHSLQMRGPKASASFEATQLCNIHDPFNVEATDLREGVDELCMRAATHDLLEHIVHERHPGIIFRNAFTGAPWTLPSHSSMLTGFPAETTGVLDQDHRLKLPTLAAHLGGHYRTHAFVENTNLLPDLPADELLEVALGANLRVLPDIGVHTFGWSNAWDRYNISSRSLAEGATFLENEAQAGAADGRPFFLFVHTNRVHDYQPRTYPGYRAALAAASKQVGELLDRVDFDRTIVVLTSDHGEGMLANAGRWHHGGRAHRDQLQANLVVWLPPSLRARIASAPGNEWPLVKGGDAPARPSNLPPFAAAAPVSTAATEVVWIERPAASIDLVPTLLDLVGYDPPSPDHFPGTHLFPSTTAAALAVFRRTIVAADTTYVCFGSIKRQSVKGAEWTDSFVDRAEARLAYRFPVAHQLLVRNADTRSESYNHLYDPDERRALLPIDTKPSGADGVGGAVAHPCADGEADVIVVALFDSADADAHANTPLLRDGALTHHSGCVRWVATQTDGGRFDRVVLSDLAEQLRSPNAPQFSAGALLVVVGQGVRLPEGWMPRLQRLWTVNTAPGRTELWGVRAQTKAGLPAGHYLEEREGYSAFADRKVADVRRGVTAMDERVLVMEIRSVAQIANSVRHEDEWIKPAAGAKVELVLMDNFVDLGSLPE